MTLKILNSGHAVGTTPELKALAADGWTIKTAWCDFEVEHRPRNSYDPQPWRSHNSDKGFRYNARELYAERPPADAEPTLEEYALASRLITGLMPGANRSTKTTEA